MNRALFHAADCEFSTLPPPETLGFRALRLLVTMAVKLSVEKAEADMRTKGMVVAIAVATGLFVTGAVAQHEEHHQDQAAPAVDKTDAGKTGGMMSGNMMMGQNET